VVYGVNFTRYLELAGAHAAEEGFQLADPAPLDGQPVAQRLALLLRVLTAAGRDAQFPVKCRCLPLKRVALALHIELDLPWLCPISIT
jgi:hypothetical protein